MRYGVAYYPEHWDETRWETDAKLMKEAGFNVVRMGEFSWVKLEPHKGEFHFDWLDKVIELLARYGIDTVLGTPTAAPPKWVVDESPDVCPKDMYGRVRGFGSRRHTCFNSSSLREHARRIVSAMAVHYSGNSHVIAWQIDNELMGRCYCENCRQAFIRWLQNKYGSLKKLNRAWGTAFWSQSYESWDELILPGYSACGISDVDNSVHNPGLELDYKRFCSDSILDYARMQAEILKQYGDWPVTTNVMPNAEHVDYFRFGRQLDFASWDDYPVSSFDKKPYSWVSMGHALTRSLKQKRFWVMEQQSGPCGWSTIGDTPEPGQLRLWAMQSLADGAEGIVYYRWRPCLYGTEEYWYGVLDHDGIPRRRYAEIQAAGADLKKTDEALCGAQFRADAAVVFSYDVLWAHQNQKHNALIEYKELVHQCYRALLRNGLSADVINETSDFSRYRVILMAAFCLATDDIRRKAETFVKNGGTLAISYRSGIKTWNNSMTDQTTPGIFREMAGVEVEEFDSLNFGRRNRIRGTQGESEVSVWCDILRPLTAEPLAHYEGGFYRGKPAIVRNRFGSGTVYYFGCDLDAESLKRYVGEVIQNVGLKPLIPECPEGVELSAWEKDGRRTVIALNHGSQPVTLKADHVLHDLLTEKTEKQFKLPGYGVAVLQDVAKKE
jgi:beta-galactosidase